jgi:hypothetical protein
MSDDFRTHDDGAAIAAAAARVGTLDELAPPVECCGVRWTSDVTLMRSGAGYGWTRHRRCGICDRDLTPGGGSSGP